MIKLVISDLDGTLFSIDHRLNIIYNDDGSKKKNLTNDDWDRFNMACVDDEPIDNVIDILHGFIEFDYCDRPHTPLVICTGGKEVARMERFKQLEKEGIYPDLLLMRKNHDYRPDYKVKRDMLKQVIKEFDVKPNEIVVFEDRQQVVDMWREEGCTCFQVAKGDF